MRRPTEAVLFLVLALLACVAYPFGIGLIHATTNPSVSVDKSRRIDGVIRRRPKSSASLLLTSLSLSPSSVTTARERSRLLTTPPAKRRKTSSTTITSLNQQKQSSEASTHGSSDESSDGGVTKKLFPDGQKKTRRKEQERDWRDGEYGASVLSKLLFRYVSPLLRLAQERRLEVSDAFNIPARKKMECVVPKLEKKYVEEKSIARRDATAAASGPKQRRRVVLASKNDVDKSTSPVVLAKALLMYQRNVLIATGLLRLLNTGIQAIPALLVARLLRLVESNAPPVASMRAAAALIAVLSVKMVVENQYFHNVVRYATQVRGALTGIIFDKSLRVSSEGPAPAATATATATAGVGGGGGDPSSRDDRKRTKKQSLGAGGVLNLMQSDASILEATALQLHTIWDGPLQITVYTYLLYKYLGRSVLWGVSVLLLTIPVNIVTLRLLNKLSKYENRAKDARTKRTTEAISNMKLLKLQGWENKFAEDIEQDRKEELRRHETRGVVRALNTAISNAVPAVVLVVTLMAYSRSGKPIVASTIFTAISLFNQLRFPLLFYPMLIDSLANGKNSLRRISAYLNTDEIIPYVQRLPAVAGQGGSIEMKNGNFLWSSRGKPAVCGANIDVQPGEVVAVVGNVGTGKSALVKALLGELAPVPRIVVDKSSSAATESSAVAENDRMAAPTVTAYGPTVYCSQEAWLSKGTLREAIIFGRPYNEERYLAAIRDAGLDADIIDDTEVIGSLSSKAAASQGTLTHETDVGEGGSSLSGGQRARVALARALYENEAGVFLLDDPLSALDASVGSQVFERITTRLRKSRAATVFVTNDPALPRRCDRVILMGMGDACANILDVGTYEELLSRGRDLQHISDDMIQLDIGKEKAPDESKIEVSPTPPTFIDVDVQYVEGFNSTSVSTCHADPDCKVHDPDCPPDQVLTVAADVDESELIVNGADGRPFLQENQLHTVVHVSLQNKTTQDDVQKSPPDAATDPTPEKQIQSADDAMTTGAVPRSTYMTYLKSIKSPALISAMLFSYLLVNGAQFFQQFVVAKWTELGGGDSVVAATLGGKYLRSLSRAAIVVSTFLWIRSFLIMKVGVRASRSLHKKMLRSVVGAPVSFFDATPSGQLISRFGKEMDVVDRALPDGIGSVLFCFLQIFASGVALAGVVTPAMLVPIGLITALYVKTMGKFRPAARDLKRCEAKTRSPIYTHFREALRGTETIRSIPSGIATWSSQHRDLTDQNLSVFYTVKALDRWLSIRLESLGNAVVFTAAIASIILSSSGKMKAGSAGWGLTQSLAITGLLTWAVRCLTDLESQMMSVLRIQEVTDLESASNAKRGKNQPISKMPRELAAAGAALAASESSKPLMLRPTPYQDSALVAAGWPWKGSVSFDNVCMRYNPASPLILKNVTIDVPAGTTLGVVGRSGSGKSSLLLTLFRLVEIDGPGSIQIDGVDIRSISLKTLRENLAIIPQDPVLFAGTVFYNLDATGKASREDAWAALETASPELAEKFRKSQGLDTLLTEGGQNLSVGQRQLMCLARALLRKSKILVLDEATSSVDSKTDAQVQSTIRQQFVERGVTVITVAHRLDTVMGYDKIVVLGNGNVLEYGRPSDLIKRRGGMFRQMLNVDMEKKKKGSVKAALNVA